MTGADDVLDTINITGPLPKEASFSAENGLMWNQQYVGSFLPCVQQVIEIRSCQEAEPYIEIILLFTNKLKSKKICLPLKDINDIDWLNLDYRCQLNPDCPKAEKYIVAIIRFLLSNAPIIKKHKISHLGTHLIDDVPVFCTGGQLIWPHNIEPKSNVILEPPPYNLTIDLEGYSERQAVEAMMKVINLTPDAGRVIFSQVLLSILRKIYIDTGITPCCIVFLIGKTGMKKTTYTAFQTQLYDRDKGIESPIRLNASISAAEALLYEKRDCIVILDDLCPVKSHQVRRKQEVTLIEVTRIIGDKVGRARMGGKKVLSERPQCGVIITGEYLIGTGSDAARLLPIELTIPIDSVKLSECQKEPLAISTFYYYFIKWYISEFQSIKGFLKKWLTEFRKEDLQVHPRLQETFFCLRSAYMLFLQYCYDKSFTEPKTIQTQHNSFQNLLLELIKAQNKRVELSADDEFCKVDYLKLIIDIYKNNQFYLASTPNKFKDKHDGLIHKDLLCLRGEKLMKKINEFIPSASCNEVTDFLITKDALKLVSDKRTIQVSGCNGKRFYAIKLEKLE